MCKPGTLPWHPFRVPPITLVLNKCGSVYVAPIMVVTDGGQRLLTNELPPSDPSKAGARLIQNWSTELAEN